MMFMVGFFDIWVNFMVVNVLVKSKLISWFEKNMISIVLVCYVGVGWWVYLGFV